MKRFALLLSTVSILSLLLVCVATPSVANAQTKRAGYKIEYLDTWPVGEQVKYIKVKITPVAGVSADDHDFYVVVNATGYQSGVKASTKVSIRKGDTLATGELYVPNNIGYNFSIYAELDGDLKNDRTDFAGTNYYVNNVSNSNEMAPSFVLASSDVIADDSVYFTVMNRGISPDMPTRTSIAVADGFLELSDLDNWYTNVGAGFAGQRPVSTFNGFSSPMATAMSLESLPSKWFGYEGLGMLMISFDDLKLLGQKHPGKLLAIERWVAASGRLVVLNCGDKLERSDDVLKLLGDQNATIRDNRPCQFQVSAATKKDIVKVRNSLDARSAEMTGGYYINGVYQTQETELGFDGVTYPLKRDTLKNALESGKTRDFLSMQFELGSVVCVSNKGSDWKTEKGSNEDRWAQLALFFSKTHRVARRSDGNRVLNDLPIRGMGFPEFDEPPRYVFEFSILAYLLAIGPLTFFILKRKHKLNLMFVVVPIVSTLFCTSILAYAIFAEGFDTRVNVFTTTKLNQRTGRQSTSAAAHVYSGMTPSAYVLDSPTYGMVNLPNGGRQQQLAWSDAGESISGGEIRARTNHQLFTRCANESDKRLSFSVSKENDEVSASVQNGFDVGVVGVVFLSEDCEVDECWFAQQIDRGQNVEAVKMDVSEVAKELSRMVRERGASTVLSTKGYSRRSSGSSSYRRGSIADVDTSNISAAFSSSWSLNKSKILHLINREDGMGFYALTEQSVNFDLPIPNAKIESEIHVLMGVR